MTAHLLSLLRIRKPASRPQDVPFNWRSHFERLHGDQPTLRCLGKPCHDCAISTGFYTPYAVELAKEDEAFQKRIAARWFCHNNTNRACAGVRDFLGHFPTRDAAIVEKAEQ